MDLRAAWHELEENAISCKETLAQKASWAMDAYKLTAFGDRTPVSSQLHGLHQYGTVTFASQKTLREALATHCTSQGNLETIHDSNLLRRRLFWHRLIRRCHFALTQNV